MSKIHTKIFTGAASALVTPFKSGKIDHDALKRSIDFQISEGISALVICGTTGEASTLSIDEYEDCIRSSVLYANGRVPIIAGSGSNCTEKAIYLSRAACKAGADALLLITPYYNKTNEEGLYKHFCEIAKSVCKPILLYNVPSRTGMNIPKSVYTKLFECENIYGVKEASYNISDIMDLASCKKDTFDIYCGNDDIVVPMLSVGGSGVISVISNILPKRVSSMCNSFFNGNISVARDTQLSLIPIIRAMFCEVNPIPIKYAMSLMGLCSPEVRAPLYEPSNSAKEKIQLALKQYNLI